MGVSALKSHFVIFQHAIVFIISAKKKNRKSDCYSGISMSIKKLNIHLFHFLSSLPLLLQLLLKRQDLVLEFQPLPVLHHHHRVRSSCLSPSHERLHHHGGILCEKKNTHTHKQNKMGRGGGGRQGGGNVNNLGGRGEWCVKQILMSYSS